jgi:hypothetical protein
VTPLSAFGDAVATWQSFYLLVGGAAATLIGLMFVAITFGSSLVTPETAGTARAFLDPVFGHFAQVLLTSCLLTIPTMGPTLLGAGLAALAAFRLIWLVRIARHTVAASQRSKDIELSDWLSGVVVPLVAHLLIAAAGVAFLERLAVAFTCLVVATLLALFNGLYGAWELMVWMAITRARTKS